MLVQQVGVMTEQQEIQNQINALVKPTSNVTGLIETLTTFTNQSTENVTSFVYALVAVILDACALFLITEKRSKTFPQPVHINEKPSLTSVPASTTVYQPSQQTEMVFTETSTNSVTIHVHHEDVLHAIRTHEINPSVRGVMSLRVLDMLKLTTL